MQCNARGNGIVILSKCHSYEVNHFPIFNLCRWIRKQTHYEGRCFYFVSTIYTVHWCKVILHVNKYSFCCCLIYLDKGMSCTFRLFILFLEKLCIWWKSISFNTRSEDPFLLSFVQRTSNEIWSQIFADTNQNEIENAYPHICFVFIWWRRRCEWFFPYVTWNICPARANWRYTSFGRW